MVAKIVLSTPTVVINNEVIAIIPNSAEYTEGLGEQNFKVQSAGGGSLEPVYSDNAETKVTDFKFKLFSTVENIAKTRGWKGGGANNAISITQGDFSRTISNAALTNNYTVQTRADGELDLEFKGSTSV
jgi:hypothetical protein